MCKLKALKDILSADDISRILSESATDATQEIDFESFLRVSATHFRRAFVYFPVILVLLTSIYVWDSKQMNYNSGFYTEIPNVIKFVVV